MYIVIIVASRRLPFDNWVFLANIVCSWPIPGVMASTFKEVKYLGQGEMYLERGVQLVIYVPPKFC